MLLQYVETFARNLYVDTFDVLQNLDTVGNIMSRCLFLFAIFRNMLPTFSRETSLGDNFSTSATNP